MTTRVTIEVPDGATYKVAVTVESNATTHPPQRTYTLGAGAKHQLYIHAGLRIVGIEEITLPANAKDSAPLTINEAAHGHE